MSKPSKEQLESMMRRHESFVALVAGKTHYELKRHGKVVQVPIATTRKNERPR